MKRIRRVSIEVERREVSLYTAASSWSVTNDRAASSAEIAMVGSPPDELAAALKEVCVHLHRNAKVTSSSAVETTVVSDLRYHAVLKEECHV